jgi:hypothetical protein
MAMGWLAMTVCVLTLGLAGLGGWEAYSKWQVATSWNWEIASAIIFAVGNLLVAILTLCISLTDAADTLANEKRFNTAEVTIKALREKATTRAELLTPRIREKMIEDLKLLTPVEVTLRYEDRDECKEFAVDLSLVFRDAGWTQHDGPPFVFSPDSGNNLRIIEDGISVQLGGGAGWDDSKLQIAADALVSQLNSAGIAAKRGVAIVGDPEIGANKMRVIVAKIPSSK